MLTGVSFGALLGAAYATGLELRQIKQRGWTGPNRAGICPHLDCGGYFSKRFTRNEITTTLRFCY